MEYWFFSRNLILKLHNKLGLFQIVLEEKFQKISLTILESQSLTNLPNLDVDTQISHFEWTLHNGRRKIHTGDRSDTKKIELIDYQKIGNQWNNNQFLQLQREEYDKLLDIHPSLLGYVETYKKSSIINDECTVENERTEFERNFKNFSDYKARVFVKYEKKTYFFVPVLFWTWKFEKNGQKNSFWRSNWIRKFLYG